MISTSSNGSTGSTGSTVNNKKTTAGVSSRSAKCSVCNKEFSKTSLKFHEPQCRRKKEAFEARQREREREEEEERKRAFAVGQYTGYDFGLKQQEVQQHVQQEGEGRKGKPRINH